MHKGVEARVKCARRCMQALCVSCVYVSVCVCMLVCVYVCRYEL